MAIWPLFAILPVCLLLVFLVNLIDNHLNASTLWIESPAGTFRPYTALTLPDRLSYAVRSGSGVGFFVATVCYAAYTVYVGLLWWRERIDRA